MTARAPYLRGLHQRVCNWLRQPFRLRPAGVRGGVIAADERIARSVHVAEVQVGGQKVEADVIHRLQCVLRQETFGLL